MSQPVLTIFSEAGVHLTTVALDQENVDALRDDVGFLPEDDGCGSYRIPGQCFLEWEGPDASIWRDVSTAPRDGTPIIALYDTNDGGHLPVVIWWSEHDKQYPWHYGTQDACREDRIAYWKPLPPMPAVVWEEL